MLPSLSPVRGANAKFANLINALAGSLAPVVLPVEPNVPESATSSVIADAMIRSMLAGPVQAAAVSTGTTAATSTATNALLQSILGTPAQFASTSTVQPPQFGNAAASPASMPAVPATMLQTTVATLAPVEDCNQATLAAPMPAAEISNKNDPAADLESQNSAKQSGGTLKRSAKLAAATTDSVDQTTLTFPPVTVMTSAPAPVAVPDSPVTPSPVQVSLPLEQRSGAPKEITIEAPATTAAPQTEIAFGVRITPAQTAGTDFRDLNAAQNDPSAPAPAPAAPAAMNPQATVTATVGAPFQSEPNPEPIATAALPVAAPTPAKPGQAARATATNVKAPAGVEREDTPAPIVRVAAATATSNSNDFTRAFLATTTVNSEAPRTNIETETPAPLNAVAESLRTSEPAATPASPAVSTPLQGITIRVAQPEAPAVDLHISERGGEIHVAVRTPDAALQTSLRQDLGTLTNSLERAGYRAETYVPRETQAPLASSPQAGMSNERQQQGSSGRGSGGNYPNGRQPQQQQQERDQRRKTWLQELENLK